MALQKLHGIKNSRFYFIISLYAVGISALAIYPTALISFKNLEKEALQTQGMLKLNYANIWWSDYMAHKIRDQMVQAEIDNLNFSLRESPSPDIHKQQLLAKYSYLNKYMYDDRRNSDSLSNLISKARGNENESMEKITSSSHISKNIVLYDFVIILLILAGTMTGISDIAKRKSFGYSAFCSGGIGIILILYASLYPLF